MSIVLNTSARRSTRGLAALTAAVAAVLAGSATAATVTLDDGQTQVYTPVAIGAAGAVDTRTFTGQAQNDTSLINFAGTANSIGTSTNLTVASQPSTTATQFLGGLNVATGGTYIFGLNTDDGSRLFIDGVLVINNEGGHGPTPLTQAITLEEGRHEIRVELVNNSGGGSIALTYAGPDQLVSGPIPSANLFRAENTVSTTVAPHTTTALGDDLVLSAGANGTIELAGIAYANAGLNSLNFGAGATLNLDGTANRDLRFGATTFNGAGTYTIANPLGDVSLGVSGGTAASTTIVKQGAGRLILDNTSATANDFTGATFDVQGGTLYAIGRNATGATNPLGSAVVQLNGGALALDTALGDVSFNNQITLAGTGGTIEAVSGPRTMTLSNTTAIAVNAGQTLNLHTLGGSNNAAGSIVVLNAALTGDGSLTKTEARAGSGAGLGIAALAGDSTGYSGAITVEAGALEGRFATVGAQPFGTNPDIAVSAGAGLSFRAGNATSNLTYNVGKNVNAAGNIVLSADRYTGTATGSAFALGTLALSGPGTVTMNSGNGHNITFTGTTLAGATTFTVNAGTLTPGTVTGNVGLTKSGAGTLNLGPANEFTGTSNLNGGVVIAPVIADVGPSSIGNDGVTLNGGTLRYTGTDAVVTTRAFNANNGTGGTIDIANAGTTFDIASAFPGASTSAVTKAGAGTLIISGALDNNSLVLNAQAGLTQLNKSGPSNSRAVAGISNIAPGATVQLIGTHGDQIYGGNATGNIGGINMTGGTLDLNGKSESVSRLNGSGVVTNNGAAGTTSILTLGEASGTAAFSGAITDGVNGGKVGLTKTGAGIASIGGSAPGSNTYSGATTINGGTLRIQAVPIAPVSGAGLWLDAADSASVELTDGFVSAWNDKSGNNRDATQTNAANRPGYTTNALVDNQGVIDFAGSQKFLNVDLTFISGSPYTLFAVEGKQSTAASNYFMGSRGSSTNNALHIGYRTDNTVTFAQYGNDINPAANNALAYTGTQDFRVWSANLSTTSGRALFIDGVQQGTTTNTGTLNVSGQGVIGQGQSTGTQYTGDIAEVLVYNSALSTADRQAVEAYLNAKWFGIGAAQNILPANTAVNITASGAILDINGSAETIASLAGVDGSAVTLGAGRLTVAGADTTTFAGAISSSGAPATSLVKAGTGTLILSGANTYSGDTVVEGGELIVTGSLTGATIIDSPAAILSGTGTAGNVTLTDGTLTAGNSGIGALATGNLALGGGTTLFDLAVDGSSDVLNVTGSVNLAAPVQLALSFNSPLVQQTVFTLFANDSGDAFDFTGGGFFAGAAPIVPGESFTFSSNGFTEMFEASFTGGDGNDFTLTVVPEPSAALSLLGGLGMLMACRRGRRKA